MSDMSINHGDVIVPSYKYIVQTCERVTPGRVLNIAKRQRRRGLRHRQHRQHRPHSLSIIPPMHTTHPTNRFLLLLETYSDDTRHTYGSAHTQFTRN